MVWIIFQLLDATIRYFIYDENLLNSRRFVIEVFFFHILPFSYRGKHFHGRKYDKILGEENFAWEKILSDEFCLQWSNLFFPKSDVTPSKTRTVINFYTKALKPFLEKHFRVYRGLGFHWSNYILSKFWKWLKQER